MWAIGSFEGESDAVVSYVKPPSFINQSYQKAKAWAQSKRVKFAVKGDGRTDNIIAQSHIAPQGLKTGEFAGTLTVTTGGYKAKAVTPLPPTPPKNDNKILIIGIAALALLLLKK